MRKLLIICLCLITMVSQGQQVNTFISAQEILVGQPDTLTVVVFSPTEKVVLPSFEETLSAQLEVLSVSKVDSVISDSGFEFHQQIYFTSFDTGVFVVPPISFAVGDSSFFSQKNEVSVVSVKVDLTKNIHGIHDIEEAPITLKEVLIIGAKAVGILLLILFIYWVVRWFYVRYKLSKESKEEIEPEIPFMDTFWERLQEIEQQKYWQKGQVKKFHSQVTGLMRSYLEYRFGINALEQTSEEILNQLQLLVTDKALYAKLEQTLRFADMVKFAKATGVQGQHEKAIENLKELVSITELKPTNQGEQ